MFDSVGIQRKPSYGEKVPVHASSVPHVIANIEGDDKLLRGNFISLSGTLNQSSHSEVLTRFNIRNAEQGRDHDSPIQPLSLRRC